MKLKSLVVAVAVLALLSAAAFFIRRPPPAPPADSRVGMPLVELETIRQAAKIRMTDQGKSVVLVKQPDSTWLVPGYYDLPADMTKLSQLTGDFAASRIERLVTTTPDRIARLEFKDSQIALLDAGDKELWSITLGKFAESGARFLRFGSEQKAYLSEIAGVIEAEPKLWADTAILALKEDEISRVEVSFPDEGAVSVAAARAKKEDAFTPANAGETRKLKSDVLKTIIGAVSSLNFTDTSDLSDEKAVSAKEHSRLVKLTTFGGQTYSITVGRKPEERILKPAGAGADTSKAGPASLLDSVKNATGETPGLATDAAQGPEKAMDAMTTTVPPGPVFAFIESSDPKARVNGLMKRRAFQVIDWSFTSLPQKSADMFESPKPEVPAAPPPQQP